MELDIIILKDGLYHLIPMTKKMLDGIVLTRNVDCFELCDVLRLKFTTYYDWPINGHIMNDDSGNFFGCICR
jgi:hypothetical protein